MEENRNEEVREEASEETLQETPTETGETSAGSAEADPDKEASAQGASGKMPDADGNGQHENGEAEEGQEESSGNGQDRDDGSLDEEAEDGQSAEEPDDENTEDSGQGENVRRGLFGKKKKDKRDQQIEELTDRVQRQMAEFDNFRKRSEKEKSAMYEVGAKSVIEKILPTIDNFERGFAGLTDEQKEDPFVQGMEKVYRQMLTTLESIGVTPIEAVGKPFDPNFHNAVMHVEDEEAEENVVVEEFQKGYLYRDAVVRHSMVKVAN